MVAARFIRGPIDGSVLLLPTSEPWPTFTVPVFEPITLQYFYVLAGRDFLLASREEMDLAPVYLYLYDEEFALETDR